METNGMLECKVKYLSLSADTWDTLDTCVLPLLPTHP